MVRPQALGPTGINLQTTELSSRYSGVDYGKEWAPTHPVQSHPMPFLYFLGEFRGQHTYCKTYVSCNQWLDMMLMKHVLGCPRGYNKFSCSTQLCMKFFLLINVKMPTIVGILTFMSRKNSILGLDDPEYC